MLAFTSWLWKQRFFRYLLGSASVLLLDVVFYFSLYGIFPAYVLQWIGASMAMLLNFFWQYTVVFDSRRHVGHAFLMTIPVTLFGIFLGGLALQFLEEWSVSRSFPVLNKGLIVCVLFIYNYISRRIIFKSQ